ncbi:MAG TPA: acyl-CoA synthetase FdrA [Spirochaetia bacterium]|nr:acyl-CoA synthetase FdrA [Spirochaetia bacterium]
MKKVIVEKDSYYDSVFLMLINKQVKQFEGVTDAVVSMGTEMNLELLGDLGFKSPALDAAGANDLIVAIEAEAEDVVEEALGSAKALLTAKRTGSASGQTFRPGSLDAAVQNVPESNLVIVSLPGEYAAREARKALNKGLHVMLFSDNVSLEQEIALKTLAAEKGLLMMGPDCGTAIINGMPLCFANVVRRGNIGIVAASGTGLQEVSCVIDKLGGGVTQAIGTGGRDLKNEKVGGTMMLMGIEALKNDPNTKVIVVVSKPPAESVAGKVIGALAESGKPSVVQFIGMKPGAERQGIHYAANLEEAAGMAVALAAGAQYKTHAFTLPESTVKELVERESNRFAPQQKFLRGLFTGGTLADEALLLLDGNIGKVYSNNQSKKELIPEDPQVSIEHTIVDLGDDVFTVGRPHPMIDPSTREERILKELEDPEVAIMMLDIVLGYGSHGDPAGAILDSLKQAKARQAAAGGYLSIVASITGTERDFQNLSGQKAKLESIGCVVMPSNYQAAMLVREILRKVA